MNEKRIAILLDSRGIGGIETHVFHLANGLAEEGLDVFIILLKDYGDHPLCSMESHAGVQVLSLSGGLFGLLRLLSRMRPHLLHTHGYKGGIEGRVVAKLLAIPVVSTFHAGEPGKGKLRFYTLIDRLSSILAVRISVSEKISRSLPYSSYVMNNFVTTNRCFSVGKGNEIAFVGRLSWEKAPDRFIRMASHFPQQQFHLYGDGPMLEQLQRDASENVFFHGMVESMAEHWSKIKLLCIPSRHEGLPLAALEAMNNGVAVIASDVGDIGKLIADADNGFICKEGDENSFVQQLQHYLSLSDNEKRNIAFAAHETILRRYSSTVVVRQIMNIYQQAVG
jgi:glycosyltransferase involved in cell wall biosynthesis